MKSKPSIPAFSKKNNNAKLDNGVAENFMNVKWGLLVPPFVLLLAFCLYFFLFTEEANYIDAYINIQKEWFFYLNAKLSEYPNLQFNLTQLGDVLIFFPFVTIFILYAPKLWEALLSSAIISLVVSASLKKLFAVPRPAAMFDHDSFAIIGRTLAGRTSLPSGHSIATFVVISVLLFAFMPKKSLHKIIWSFVVLTLGLVIAFSRVGVGAHYPIDVLVGSTLGYMVTVIGIMISNKMHWGAWMNNKKYYPIFMLLLPIWGFIIAKKIMAHNLPIFYLSVCSLVVTLYLLSRAYIKKN